MSHRTKYTPNKLYRIVLIGDVGIGKTSLLLTFLNEKFPVDYIPSINETFIEKQSFHNKLYEIEVVDTLGKMNLDFDNWGEKYSNADLYFMCFSVVDPVSLNNVHEWIDKVQTVEDNPKFLLVGLKIDLRTNDSIINALRQQDTQVVSHEQAYEKAKEIHAIDYLECSALNGIGVQSIFNVGFEEIVQSEEDGGCCAIF